ncbi:MAG: glycosyltransferase family 87 protein, partial [Pseudomonadota bacterium]
MTEAAIARLARVLATIWGCLLALWLIAIAIVLNYRDLESWPTDFTVFWRVAVIALEQDPNTTYDNEVLGDVWTVPTEGAPAHQADWLYPPTALFAFLPLGLMPFSLSLTVFSALSLLVFALSLRRLAAPLPGGVLLLLASPAIPVAVHLANTTLFFAAGLACVTASLAARKPLSAGAATAVFMLKPQLGIAFPIAFAAGGHWRAFAAAAVTCIGIVALSLAAFGIGNWEAFAEKTFGHIDAMARWEHLMISVYAMVKLLTGDTTTALAIDAATGLAAAVLLVLAMRKEPSGHASLALLCLVLAFLQPRLFYYDCVFFLVAMVHLWRAGAGETWAGRLVLFFCWSGLPAVSKVVTGDSLALVVPLMHGAA